MGIRLKRFPEYGLELFLYSGAVSCEEMLAHLRRVDASADWLAYFDATADLSGIDVAHLPALKRAVAAKEGERDQSEPGRHALVNVPQSNEPLVRFWSSYVRTGVPHPHTRAAFATVGEACAWLGLPSAGCHAVAAEVERAEADAAEPTLEPAGLFPVRASPGSPGPEAGGRPARS